MHPVERLTRHWKKRVRTEEAMSTNPQDGSQPTVVLVHGGFADGSGWQGVYNQLKDDYSVRIVQEPNLSHQGDVEATKMIIGQLSDPVILVGHSYGGAVITEAGNHPNVAAPYRRRSTIGQPLFLRVATNFRIRQAKRVPVLGVAPCLERARSTAQSLFESRCSRFGCVTCL
jgi:pimeloyl-ACP methyl ester carboxylesterase